MRMKMKRYFAILLTLLLWHAGTGISFCMDFDANSAILTHPYFKMKTGIEYLYAGYGTFSGYRHYVAAEGVETIDGVDCLKIVVRGFGNNPDPDKDPEWERYWLAQDTDGNIWTLQASFSESDIGSVFLYFGKDNAKLTLPKKFTENTKFANFGYFYREYIGDDLCPVLSTGLGPFLSAKKVRYVGDRGTDIDIEYFVKGLFIVRDEWNDYGTDGWELKEIVKDGRSLMPGSELVAFDTGFRPSQDGFDICNGDFYEAVLSEMTGPINSNSHLDLAGSCFAMCVMAKLYYDQYKNGKTSKHFIQALEESPITASALYLNMPLLNMVCGKGLQLYSIIERLYVSDNLTAVIRAYQDILRSGLPSIIGIQGTNTDGKKRGHTLLAYKITYEEGVIDDIYRVYVYDPNLPNQDHVYIDIKVENVSHANIVVEYDWAEEFYSIPNNDITSFFADACGQMLNLLLQ